MSCAYKILILIWPRMRKFSQVLQVGKAVNFDSPWSRVGHVLCPRPLFMFWLVKSWLVSSCGKFMQHLQTCLWITEVDRGLCHLVMFLSFCTGCTKWNTAACKILLFISGLFIGGLVEKCVACQSHWKSDFRWHRVHLICKRVEKLTLLVGFQELQHLDW